MRTPTIENRGPIAQTIHEAADGMLVARANSTPLTYAHPCVQRDPHIGSDAGARAATLFSVSEALAAAFRTR
ncbi:hypothetical protein ACRBEV_21025 [Methylobacterium phyllosphaerae]